MILVALLPGCVAGAWDSLARAGCPSALDPFAPGWLSPDLENDSALSFADFDADGDLDLAIASYTGAPLRVYENPGDGAFTLLWSSVEYDIGQAVAWGDWDGDGDLDLAVANDGSPRVYRNDGGGAFTLAWSGTSESTSDVAWRDQDGDGLSDLVTVADDGPIRVHRSTGTDFTPTWISATIENLTAVAWADADGDGWGDLAVAGYYDSVTSDYLPVRVYRYDPPTAAFVLAWTSPELAAHWGVDWADADGDGDLDLAVAISGSGVDRVYENQGGWAFAVAWEAPTADNSFDVAWGDVDNDGDADLAYANGVGPDRVFRNDGGWAFELVASSPHNASGVDVTWGDVDGDGILDLGVARALGRASEVYRTELPGKAPGIAAPVGDPGHALTDEVPSAPSAWVLHELTETAYLPRAIAAADLDGDGLLDLLSASEDGRIAWYRGAGSGGFEHQQLVDRTAVGATALAVADLDGDGHLDVLSGASESSRIAVHEGLGAGAFAPPKVLAADAAGVEDLAVADLDRDGLLDVVAIDQDGLTWFANRGGGAWTDPVELVEVLDGRAVAVADLDGDGFSDVLYATGRDQRVGLMRGLGGGAFEEGCDLPGAVPDPTALEVIDLDGDGWLDVLATGFYQISHWRNLGQGVFASDSPIGVELEEITAVRAGDLDGDGDLDLTATDRDGFAWYVFDGERYVLQPRIAETDGWDLALADLDGDGDLDAVTAAEGYGQGSAVDLRRWTTAGFGAREPVLRPVHRASTVDVTDVDGDGQLDVVAAGYSDSAGVIWFAGLPGGFDRAEVLLPWEDVVSSAAADLDGDGIVDLAFGSVAFGPTSPEPGLWWARGLSGGGFGSPAKLDADPAIQLFAFDADLDGQQDLLGYQEHWYYTFYSGIGMGPQSTILGSGPNDYPLTAAVGDVDGDGDLDVLAAWQRWDKTGDDVVAERVAAYTDLRVPGGETLVLARGWYTPGAVALGDLDGDLVSDLVVGNGFETGASPLVVFFGSGDGSYGTGAPVRGSEALRTVVAAVPADFDLDGDNDLALADSAAGELVLLRNDGTGFQAPLALTGGVLEGSTLRASDVDRDGDLDLVAAIPGDDRVLWLENPTLPLPVPGDTGAPSVPPPAPEPGPKDTSADRGGCGCAEGGFGRGPALVLVMVVARFRALPVGR